MNIQNNSNSQSKDKIISFLFIIPAAALFFVFARAGQPERGLMAAFTLGVILTVGYVRRDLRRTLGLWIVLGLVGLLNGIVIYNIELSRFTAPALTVGPIFIFETLLVLGILWGLDRIKAP